MKQRIFLTLTIAIATSWLWVPQQLSAEDLPTAIEESGEVITEGEQGFALLLNPPPPPPPAETYPPFSDSQKEHVRKVYYRNAKKLLGLPGVLGLGLGETAGTFGIIIRVDHESRKAGLPAMVEDVLTDISDSETAHAREVKERHEAELFERFGYSIHHSGVWGIGIEETSDHRVGISISTDDESQKSALPSMIEDVPTIIRVEPASHPEAIHPVMPGGK